MSILSNSANKFGKQVVKESKTALTKQDKNASRKGYNSIRYTFKESKNSFEMAFFMEDYLTFVDKGVTGKNDPNFKGKKKTINKSLAGFRFGSGNFKGKGGEWEKKIDSWMYSRGIQGRDAKGKFIKRKTVNFLIRRSIYQHGLKPTLFFTKPFNSAFKHFPDEVVKSYGLDVENLLRTSLNNK